MSKRRLHKRRRSLSNAKDVSWRRRKVNPHAREGRSTLRRFVMLGILLVVALLEAVIIFTHPFFQINNIQVKGADRIEPETVVEVVRAGMQHKLFGVVPATNYFLIAPERIEEVLLKRFSLKVVDVRLVFPHKLDIVLEEKTSTLIYDNGKHFAFLDLRGVATEKIRQVGDTEWKRVMRVVTSTEEFGDVMSHEEEISRSRVVNADALHKEMGDYPIITHADGRDMQEGQEALDPDIVSGIALWSDELSKHTSFDLDHFRLEHEQGDITIFTSDGPFIHASVDDVARQIEDLTYILDNEVGESAVEYVDVRYDGRIFWK